MGEWAYEMIDYEPHKHGFRIYSSDVRGTFRRRMKQHFEMVADFKMIPFSLNHLIDIFYQKSSIIAYNPYLKTIWELSALCPLPYYDTELSPIHFSKNRRLGINDSRVINFLKQRNQLLIGYHFNLYFDGIELKRLIQLGAALLN